MKYWCIALALVAGCGHDALPGAADLAGADLAASADLATPIDLATPVDLATPAADISLEIADLASPPRDFANGFCGNPNSATAQFGAAVYTPSVSSSLLVLNCCDAATVDFTNNLLLPPVTVMWRHQVGQGPNPPIDIDLANLPQGWTVSLVSGCPGLMNGCQPTDRYDTGLRGTLHITGNMGQYQTSVCLFADEDPNNKHPIMHHVWLWTPPVAAK